MNEELKVIISAEMSKLKQGVAEAKSQIDGFKQKCADASKDVDGTFKKMGEGIGNAVKAGAKAATAAVATIGTALAGIVTSAVSNYAEYEQLVGGVEKLFGDSASTVMKYAQDAYKNAGVSANDYMTQITSFSASLISSLGGDTAAAAEIGNMAVQDMSDNANVFGSNIQDIQNAYQGFAKQNYTMLDNLKLGYGGTKTEMMRLIDDANKILETMGKTGDLTITEFGDVITAIHLVQEEMKITGTTANEAEGTISGSITMMKTSWENLMTGLADSNADIPTLVQNVLSSATSVLENVIPIAKEVIKQLPAAISEISPEAGAALQSIIDFAEENFPKVKEALSDALTVIKDIFNWVKENEGVLTAAAAAIGVVTAAVVAYNAVAAIKAAMAAAEVTTVWGLVAAYAAHAVAVIAAIAPYVAVVAAIAAVIAIIVLCVKHWDDIKEAAGKAWEWIKEKVSAGVEKVKESVSNMVDKVKEYFGNMGDNISKLMDKIKTWLSEKWEAVKKGVVEKVTGLKDKAVETFENLKKGLSEKITGAKNKVSEVVTGLVDGMKEKFTGAKDKVVEVFNNIKNSITEKIDGAKTAVSEAIDKIKGFFDFEWSLPKLKLPKISIEGEFSLSPLRVPKFSLNWNALGGVFDSPTIFGYKGGLQGIGEAGAEAVVPLENNLGWLDKLAGMLDERMNSNTAPIVLQVDGKTFAQLSVDSINQLTRQRGSIPLVIA